jgi:hypothetical protein
MPGNVQDGERAERTVLTETEQRILALKIGSPKMTHAEIAMQLGLNRVTVSTMINRDPLRRAIDDHLTDLVETAREYALSSVGKAFARLIDLIDNAESDNVKRLCSRDLINILAKRGDSDSIGDEEWEAVIGTYGQIKVERTKRIDAATGDKEDEEA